MNLIRKYWIYLILLPMAVYSCQDCDDCGPSQNEPYVNLKFFNIDSLLKVRDTLTYLNDSLGKINEAIAAGDTSLTDEKNEVEKGIDLYENVEEDISQGRIRIDEVYGAGGEGPLFFRDSLTNDSLSVFRFPLDMNRDESSFLIKFQEKSNEIGFSYTREIDQGGDFIVLRVYDIGVTGHSFDSVTLICNQNVCTSNETTFRIYF